MPTTTTTPEERTSIEAYVLDRGLSIDINGDMVTVRYSRVGFIPDEAEAHKQAIRRYVAKLGHLVSISTFRGGFFVRISDRKRTTDDGATIPPDARGSRPAAATDLHRMNGAAALYWQEKVTNAAAIIDRVQATGDLDHQDAAQLIEWLQVIVADVQRWQQLTHARETSADTN